MADDQRHLEARKENGKIEPHGRPKTVFSVPGSGNGIPIRTFRGRRYAARLVCLFFIRNRRVIHVSVLDSYKLVL